MIKLGNSKHVDITTPKLKQWKELIEKGADLLEKVHDCHVDCWILKKIDRRHQLGKCIPNFMKKLMSDIGSLRTSG